MSKLVLVLNCGSSSLKFAVIDATTGDDLLSGLAGRWQAPDASTLALAVERVLHRVAGGDELEDVVERTFQR